MDDIGKDNRSEVKRDAISGRYLRRFAILALVAGVPVLAGLASYLACPHQPPCDCKDSPCPLFHMPEVCSVEQAKQVYEINAYQKAATDKIIAASRLLKNQDGLDLWDTPRGRFWMLPDNLSSMAYVLVEQDANIYGDSYFGVRPGDIVLDCGAHFGGFTRKALEDGAALVVAIEIAPENVECLRRTFADEIAAKKVVVFPEGVWDKDDTLVLNRQSQSWGDSVVIEDGRTKGSKVPLTTIDKIVRKLGLSRVDFIKMDIEGAEEKALMGARATIAKFKPRIAAAGYHLPDDPVNLPRVVRSAEPGYWFSIPHCRLWENGVRPESLNFIFQGNETSPTPTPNPTAVQTF